MQLQLAIETENGQATAAIGSDVDQAVFYRLDRHAAALFPNLDFPSLDHLEQNVAETFLDLEQ